MSFEGSVARNLCGRMKFQMTCAHVQKISRSNANRRVLRHPIGFSKPLKIRMTEYFSSIPGLQKFLHVRMGVGAAFSDWSAFGL
jgi:hypothetical protein